MYLDVGVELLNVYGSFVASRDDSDGAGGTGKTDC
jgi:hypothetical protein